MDLPFGYLASCLFILLRVRLGILLSSFGDDISDGFNYFVMILIIGKKLENIPKNYRTIYRFA